LSAAGTVERLMRAMGLQGVIRGKTKRTTVSDKVAPCPLDHVNRQFRVTGHALLRRISSHGGIRRIEPLRSEGVAVFEMGIPTTLVDNQGSPTTKSYSQR
jgi:hypothetical protein